MYGSLLAAIERRRGGVGELRLCICGGAPLTRELQDRWFDTTGVELRNGYGRPEASPLCLFNRADRANVRGALGVPSPGVEVTIRMPRAEHGSLTAVLPVGTSGEICVRGDHVFTGYLDDGADGLTVRDGWLYTGDHGTMHGDGTVTLDGAMLPIGDRAGRRGLGHQREIP